jgi:hypothetical protein
MSFRAWIMSRHRSLIGPMHCDVTPKWQAGVELMGNEIVTRWRQREPGLLCSARPGRVSPESA